MLPQKLFVLSSPRGEFMKKLVTKFAEKGGALALLALLLLAVAAPAAAQKNKDKKKQQPQTAASADAKQAIQAPDSQAVDQTVGEALGYWQIGDVESLHKYYADDVIVVSGLWEVPVIGWDNYLKAYQAQRAQVMGGRMDRSNTYIKVDGSSAWATYQFVYTATVNGKIAEFRGHTTLILNKRGDRWVIVLNHSSVVPEATQTGPAPIAAPAQPGRP
jgi:ketosteroid isomerase-like protein